MGELEYNLQETVLLHGGKPLYLTFLKALGAPGERDGSQNIPSVFKGFLLHV